MTRQEWMMDASAMAKMSRTGRQGNGLSSIPMTAFAQRANREFRNHVAG